jgi:uncharacterized protein YfaP (DUF2135 family)
MVRLQRFAALAALALVVGCVQEDDSGTNPGPLPLPTGSASGSVTIDLSNSTGADAVGTVSIAIGDEVLEVPVNVSLGSSRTVTVDYTFPSVTVGRTSVIYVAEIDVGGQTYTEAGFTTVSVEEGMNTTVDESAFLPISIDPSFTPTGNISFSNLSLSATTVNDPIVELSGTVSNSDIGQVFVYVNGYVFLVNVSLYNGTGEFDVWLTLDPGSNEIVVIGMNSNGTLVVSSPLYVTYNSTIAGNTMLGTLVWDSPTSDIDLHLWYYTQSNPTDTSAYSYHCYYPTSSRDIPGIRPDVATDSTGNLDRDDVDGYGPEHMTLIGYPDGYYVFALHRFSMHSDLSSNCNFTLKIGSATRTTSYTFSSTSNVWYRCYDVRVVNGTATILSPDVSLGIALGKALVELPAKAVD